MKRLLPIFITLLIFGCTSQSDKSGDQNEIKEEGLPVYNIDPETFIPREFGIMDLVNDDLEIIRLETCLECALSYPNPTPVVIEDEFILIGSIRGMRPGELLLFSSEGKYRHKFGSGGRGPEEHVGWTPRKIRYYKEDSTVLVYWGGNTTEVQLFDLNGEFKYQIDLPYSTLGKTIERWSDSTWFATGQDDWGSNDPFGIIIPGDSIRLILFDKNGDLIRKVPRSNYPSLNNLQQAARSQNSSPYSYQGTWKFNMKGNDTLFSIIEKKLKPNAILNTPVTDFPLSIKVVRETEAFLMLDVWKYEVTGIGEKWGNPSTEAESEGYDVFVDKLSGKSYSIVIVDDVFFILDDFNMYFGRFMDGRLQWSDDRLSFVISPLDWMELSESMDTSKLRPTIREKLKVLEGLSEDDNPIIFTFTLKDEIDFE